MKNQDIKNYQTERREQLIEAGLSHEEAKKIAFQETQKGTLKELRARADSMILDEIVGIAFLSGMLYSQQLEKKKATLTQHQAMQNTKKIVRQMLHN